MDTQVEEKRETYTPLNANETSGSQVLLLSNGSAVIGEHFKLDPFVKGCMVSVHQRSSPSVPENGAMIPVQHRPRLSDLRRMLKSDSANAQAIQKAKNFTLVPLDGSNRFDASSSAINTEDQEYRVMGFLKPSIRKACGLLAAEGYDGFDREEWIPVADAYRLITRGAVRQIKSIHDAFGLSVYDHSFAKTPIVVSDRFKNTRDHILKAFLKPHYNAVLLKGKSGVGKSRIFDHLAYRFCNMQVPSRLQGWLIASMGIELFMPSNHSAEELEKARVREMIAGWNVIWVIDEAGRLVERGHACDLDNLLLFIDRGAKLILSSDQACLLEKREAFRRRLSSTLLRPSDPQETEEIASVLADHQARELGIGIEPSTVATALKYSYASPFEQPHAVSDLLTSTFAECELRGEPCVTSARVQHEFRQLFSQGDRLPEIPAKVEDFIQMLRLSGYCGHEGFLKDYGARLLSALSRRFRADRKGVVWACLVVGNSGNGKTTLLEMVAQMISGSESKVMTIHCSSYRGPHALQSLIGSPKSYIGYEEGGALQNFCKQNPDGILIVEEPEQGHPNILQLVKEVLDGTFSAGDGTVVSTRGLTVLISSNAGCESNREKVGIVRSADTRKMDHVKDNLEDLLTPALFSRIGTHNVFYLPPLSSAALRNILRLAIAGWGKAEGVNVSVDDDVVHYIVDSENTNMLGARVVLDRYRNDIESLLEKQLWQHGEQGIKELKIQMDESQNIRCACAGHELNTAPGADHETIPAKAEEVS